MKKLAILIVGVALLLSVAPVFAKRPNTPPGQEGKDTCVTIQSGDLKSSTGETLTTGYDMWGYNYQAHMFNGYYGNYSRPKTLVTEGDKLIMKWSDEWLSNKDCNGDGKLDRGYSCDPENADNSACPGAWLTNRQSGVYEGEEGEICKWNYFVKIVAVPEDAREIDGIWYTTDGEEIGPEIWGAFAIVQEVYNDPCEDVHGLQYVSPVSAGFGYYK